MGLTEQEYLAFDRAAEYRSEYVRGEMFAMSGGSPRHARLGAKVSFQLSPSTTAYDRGLKFQLYRQIPSLSDYLLVHADDILIEHYSRQPNEGWLLREYRGAAARLPLPNLGCELDLGVLYAGVMQEPG